MVSGRWFGVRKCVWFGRRAGGGRLTPYGWFRGNVRQAKARRRRGFTHARRSFTARDTVVREAAGGGAARKGGTPGEGSPFNPLLRFISTRRVPRAAARGQGSAPGPRPLFCKKAGQKTFKRQSTSDPSPSPLGRVIQSVREADTLAAEWQLPREWERRVGPETSRGRHHPISVFLWGSTPFLWARPKKWGGTCSTNVKSSRTKRRVPPSQTPTSGRDWNPAPTDGASGRFRLR